MYNHNAALPPLDPAATNLASEPANKSDLAYARIEELITFQDLPPGRLVSETMLAKLTGLSRTSVREALQQRINHRTDLR
jgi:DNA-binding GntR family transcriptional regulator